ncbi:MAG: glycyl-radical enzyme activating protein [Deltaproteobacteria bacterium]|nr:glycyl-radical enzyme activating protein [Deltaproteobacteria bacterium]
MKTVLASNPTEVSPSDQGLVFNIQNFSLHDGAGIRTLVFLKGCPLRCKWCSNPESQDRNPELGYNANNCIGVNECGWCLEACEREAIHQKNNGKIDIDRSLCNNCGDCVNVCPSKAFELFGQIMSTDGIIKMVESDSVFFARSGGGLTLGGGDPVFQPEFAANLLKAAHARGINTAMETAGHCQWEDLSNICQYADTVIFDIKSVQPLKHRQEVGVGNKKILDNFKKLCLEFSHLNIIVRTPVIPEFNNTEDDIQTIVEFLNGITGWSKYELLPYHAYGEGKYRQLGRAYPIQNHLKIDDDKMKTLKQIALNAKSN